MQDRTNEALLKEQQKSNQLKDDKPGVLSVESSNDNKQSRVQYPPFWRKKKLSEAFVKHLQVTANSKPIATDKFGEYRLGVFLYGCVILKVDRTDGLLSISIYSEHPIGLPMIKEIRYKFAPDDMLMTMLMPSRDQKISDNTVVIYQIPGSFNDENIQDAIFED